MITVIAVICVVRRRRGPQPLPPARREGGGRWEGSQSGGGRSFHSHLPAGVSSEARLQSPQLFLCKCYANDTSAHPWAQLGEGEGWADPPGFSLAGPVLFLPQRGANAGPLTTPVLGAERGREGDRKTLTVRETKKGPSLGRRRTASSSP